MGVIDAREEGMPTVYVDNIIRKFIPDVRDDSVVKFAQQQAHLFDESADTVWSANLDLKKDGFKSLQEGHASK